MAKSFYKIEEAAQRLGKSVEEIKAMAARGQLRQFRDRDTLLFKADEVDALASSDESHTGLSVSPGADDSAVIKLDDSGDTGVISLSDTTGQSTGAIELTDTGIQDTGEISLADTNLGDTSLGDTSGPGGSTSLGMADDSGADISLADDEIKLADTAGGTAVSSTGVPVADDADLSSPDALTVDDADAKEGSSGLGLALDDIGGSSAGGLELEGTGAEDAIDLGDKKKTKQPKEDARQATGISVFDADEIEAADPMAATLVTTSPTAGARPDEDLALDSVGSGSGLLDLTRESDDTSLGAELLDEIYPNADQTPGDSGMDTAAGSSGVFDGAVTLEAGPAGTDTGQSTGTGLASSGAATAAVTQADATAAESAVLDVPTTPAPALGAPGAGVVVVEAPEALDPVGSGWTGGLLTGAFAALVMALIVAMGAIVDAPASLTSWMGHTSNNLWTGVGALSGATVVLAIVGFFLGRMFR